MKTVYIIIFMFVLVVHYNRVYYDSQTSASTQNIIITQAHLPVPPSAPPRVDDFGDFQHGQAHYSSSQPSFPSQPVPLQQPSSSRPLGEPAVSKGASASLQASVQTQNSSGGGDKYGIFDELRSAGGGLLSQSKPPTDTVFKSSTAARSQEEKPPTEDKYGAFGDFHSSNSSTKVNAATAVVKNDNFGNFSSAPPPPPSSTSSNTATSQWEKDGFPAFSSSSSTAMPAPIASSGSDSGSNSGGGFASFPGSASQEARESQMGSSSEGWAAFTDFPSSHGTSDILSNLPTTYSKDPVAKSKADSAFESLLPPELLPSKTSKTVKPAEPTNPVEPAHPGSLDNQPPVTTSSTSSATTAVGLDITSFESDQPLMESKEKRKEVKKQLTGLEILEEEFSARMTAKATLSTAPADILEPLVPESAPLDEFGDFEAYSSPGGKEKNKVNLLPGGESPSSLKKVRAICVY